jgi:hypothetical protein
MADAAMRGGRREEGTDALPLHGHVVIVRVKPDAGLQTLRA